MDQRQADTDSLGLPRSMWWLWPFVVLLVVIWVITLWAVRVSDTATALGVVVSHEGLSTNARAEIAVLVPDRLRKRVLGETVLVKCLTISIEGEVFGDASEILSIQDIRDWVGSRLLADTLATEGVRLQPVKTQPSEVIPSPGEHCDVVFVSGRVRLLQLLWRSLDQ